MKNKEPEEVGYDILITFALFMVVCAGLATAILIAYLIGSLIKVAG